MAFPWKFQWTLFTSSFHQEVGGPRERWLLANVQGRGAFPWQCLRFSSWSSKSLTPAPRTSRAASLLFYRKLSLEAWSPTETLGKEGALPGRKQRRQEAVAVGWLSEGTTEPDLTLHDFPPRSISESP